MSKEGWVRRRTFLKGAGVAALSGLAGRSWAADTVTAADLAGDVAILREALKLHPGLYRYNSPAGFERKLEGFAANFTAAPDRAARYLALARLTAEIRCGHSYANFSNQKKAVAADLFDRPTRLPLHFVWLGDAMVVARDPSGSLAAGTRILSLEKIRRACGAGCGCSSGPMAATRRRRRRCWRCAATAGLRRSTCSRGCSRRHPARCTAC